jgi:hypothetical protein
MKKLFTFIFALVIFSGSFAASFPKYASEFLYTAGDSRAWSMGSAYVAATDNATSGFWNPAGLVNAPGLQVYFTHTRQFLSSIQYDYVAASNQFEDGTILGFSFLRLGISEISKVPANAAIFENSELVGLDYSKISKFGTSDNTFILSFAKKYSDDIFIGANAKLIYRDFSTESAYGIGFDAGMQYKWYPELTVGLMLRDITTTMIAWSTGEKEFITPSIRAGLSYDYSVSDWGLNLRPAMEFGFLFESRDAAAQLNLGPLSLDSFWGMETVYKDLLFLRLGYDDLERFNGGLGLSITKFGVDYSYTNFDQDLGNVHRISFHVKLDAI